MSRDLEEKCVCGHKLGTHSGGQCQAHVPADGSAVVEGHAFTGKRCNCEQFVAEAAVDAQVTGTQVVRRADVAMYDAEPMPTNEGRLEPQVTLLSATPDPLGALAAACFIYEGRVIRDLAEVTDEDRKRFWEQMKKTALNAPLECIDFHFMIEGVTRAFTHQIVRQRTAFYAQESLRFAVKDNMATETPMPLSIKPGSPEELIWHQTIDDIETSYNGLIDMGIPAEDARGLLPHQTTTRLHYKTNMRGLLQHAGLRLCTQAQFEWRIVFAKIVDAIRHHDPFADLNGWDIGPTPPHLVTGWQFELMADDGQFRPICYQTGECQFGADFDRHCSIRERVQAGEWDKINPAEWLANPAAARKAE